MFSSSLLERVVPDDEESKKYYNAFLNFAAKWDAYKVLTSPELILFFYKYTL